MTDTITQTNEGVAPTPAPDPSPPEQDFNSVLDEYVAANPTPQEEQPPADDWERTLAELMGPKSDPLQDLANEQARNQIAELQGENARLLAEQRREIDQRDFDRFALELQSELPSHLPSNYAANALWAAAAKDKNLVAAFDARNMDVKAADAEFRKLEVLYNQVVRSPDNDPRKQSALAVLYQRGEQLGLIMNSREILRRARSDIVKQAREWKPIDEEQTQIRAEVAAAVRGASVKIAPEREPNYGQMDGPEGRRAVKERYGFDPGW
jgi:hypothetical protein